MTTITAHQVADPESRLGLPDGWTGVTWHWPGGDFTECREHVEANPVGEHDSPVSGTLLFDDVSCDQDHTADHLARIDEALADETDARDLARLRVQTVVREAQAAGLTWQQIADHLGVTRQSAWERFR